MAISRGRARSIARQRKAWRGESKSILTSRVSSNLVNSEIAAMADLTPLMKKINNHNLRLRRLENCVCYCDTARWEDPFEQSYAAGTSTPVWFQTVTRRGKWSYSRTVPQGGTIYKTSKDGVVTVNTFISITLSTPEEETGAFTRLEVWYDDMFYALIDKVFVTDLEEYNLQGTTTVSAARGKKIQIMLYPSTVSAINAPILMEGFVDFIYECKEI